MSGRLGAIEGTATTWKTLYKPASGTIATVMVTACNRAAAARTVRIASAQSASADPTPGDGEIMIYDRPLAAAGDEDGKDVLQLTEIVLNGAQDDQIVVYVSDTDVDFLAHGRTES